MDESKNKAKESGKILAIIPARGGSKRLPRKALRTVGGKTLIERAIECAQDAECIDEILFSTDDKEYAEAAETAGVTVGFMRPGELAADESSTWDVLRHTLDWYRNQKADEPEYIVCLQPDSPLRFPLDIDNAVSHAKDNSFEFLVSVTIPFHHPHWCFEPAGGGTAKALYPKGLSTRSQDLPEIYIPNGAVYVVTPSWLDRSLNTYPEVTGVYLMPPERSVDIDTEFDLALAEFLANYTRHE
jgi:N-acylneuraminate cytidylyltransferase/CMP-N,N'-diacetyllegionaminic acid synthase